MEKKIDSRSFRGSVVKKPYSPKALPPKRSSAVSGVQRQLPRSSHPMQYHVSQTWTQRGRLRELRFRCVARKFLYLWIRMTFGRVFPSRARFYHEQRILRKAFVEWKEEWWVSQREWKLCIRADCHYRYYLYSLVFQNWKTYVYQRQEMRSKYRRAEDHETKQKMRRAWKSWLIYVVVRRTKHHMQTTALEFKQRSVLRVWWSKWKQRVRQARMNHTLYATAVKHRALILQLQAWSQWQEQLLRSQRHRRQVVAAVRHHQRRQKQRALEAWLRYLHIRREKRWWNEMAARFHRVTVLQTHFCDWQWAWEWRQSLSAHQALVEQLAKRMALRRVFTHWRHYMLLRSEEAAQWEAAAQHRRHSLLCFGFRALKNNVTQARLQRIRKSLAHRHQGVLLLRKFWGLWQCRMEQREESQQLPSLHAAWSHHRATLLRKCVRLWLTYMQKRRRKQLLQARAHQHFQQRALPAAFLTWRRLWHQRWQEGALDTRAVRFHRETLEKRAFAVWRQMMFQCRENRLAERLAILQAERQLLQRFWFTWRQQAAAHHQEREWQAVARVYHHHRLLWKAFNIWRERAQGFQTERTGRTQAVRLHSARLLRWAWSGWRECLALRADEQQKLLCADLHSRRAMLHRALHNWLAYQDRVRHVLREVAARESQHQRQLLRWVLHRWRENAVARLDEARKTSQANTHYRRTLCSKVLAQWRKVTSMQICYRQEEAAALREAQKVLERGCLRNWFWRWQHCSQRAAQQRAQLHQAAQHYRQQLLLEGMARWKAHHRECARKRLLQRQGAQLLARRLSRAYFYQWKQQLVVRKREQQSTAGALWFWALSLQAKVWAAWLGFVLERRRKKARLDRAMQAYHRQLLQEGATRLLRFAAGAKAFRQQLQAEQQAQAAHSLHRAVRRCAELWKKKALGPRRKLPTPAPTAPRRRVRFEDLLLTRLAAEAGDSSLHAPQSQGTLVGRTPSAGEPLLPDLNAVRSARKQPRCPPFLLEPVQSQRSPGYCTLRKQGLEKPLESGQGMAQPAGLPLRRPLLPGALQNTPVSKTLPPARPGLEALLWPPSSSMPHRAQVASRVSTQPANHEYQPQACPSLAMGPDPYLFVHGDFSSTGYDSEAAGNTELEAELEGILQQLQHYQTTKQNLRSCQRQANSLRRWLELSQEEPRPEDQDAEQQVQKELEEVELQIQQLAKELQAQRRPVGTCIARVRALRQALCQ